MFKFPIEINELNDVPDAYKGLYAPNQSGDGFALEPALASQMTAETDQQIIQTLTTANEGLQNDLEALRSESDRLLIEKTAVETISKGQGNINLLMPHMKAALHIQDVEGRRQVQVNTATLGLEGLSKDGASMSADDLLAHFKGQPDFAAAFAEKAVRGSGMNPASSGGTGFNLRSADQAGINSKIEEIAAGKITVTL